MGIKEDIPSLYKDHEKYSLVTHESEHLGLIMKRFKYFIILLAVSLFAPAAGGCQENSSAPTVGKPPADSRTKQTSPPKGKTGKGATLQGKAVLTGPVPPPRFYHLVLFPNMDLCSKVETDAEMNRIIEDFEVAQDGGLKDVVVSIEHVSGGKPFAKPTLEIKSEHCKFTPYVNAVRQDETFKVDNLDLAIHNSQVYQAERGKIIANIPIWPEKVADGHVHFQKDYKIFQMICGMHEFMQTWGYRVQNPYYFITGDDGTFHIDGVPPGDYVVNAWHPLMDIRSQNIRVTGNEVVQLNFEFDGNEVDRATYETISSGRIKKDAFKSREETLKNKTE